MITELGYAGPRIVDLPYESKQLLDAQGNRRGYEHRGVRLAQAYPHEIDGASPFLTKPEIQSTYSGTQDYDENHRRFTPVLQELFHTRRQMLMDGIDKASTKPKLNLASYDVLVIGSGPHGAAIASGLRAVDTTVTVAVVDEGPIGGQFRRYGPKPVFAMNSRIRRANRDIPPRPRTPGSINPLGRFAPLELSDVVMGTYAMNTEMGDVCAINTYLSADEVMANCKVVNVEDGRVGYKAPDGKYRSVRARVVVDATGLSQQTVIPLVGEVRTLYRAMKQGVYFNTDSFYRHFATHAVPLKAFDQRSVAVVGAGDSALTVMEALIGVLPRETYGLQGVGRLRPRQIVWMGAPADNIPDVLSCLRSRYKNGIPQELTGPGRSGLVRQLSGKVTGCTPNLNGWILTNALGTEVICDIVIDCTNEKMYTPILMKDWQVDIQVGPADSTDPPSDIAQVINQLGIKENTTSLWATMERTDAQVQAIRTMVLSRR